jgi:hypothetical protein
MAKTRKRTRITPAEEAEQECREIATSFNSIKRQLVEVRRGMAAGTHRAADMVNLLTTLITFLSTKLEHFEQMEEDEAAAQIEMLGPLAVLTGRDCGNPDCPVHGKGGMVETIREIKTTPIGQRPMTQTADAVSNRGIASFLTMLLGEDPRGIGQKIQETVDRARTKDPDPLGVVSRKDVESIRLTGHCADPNCALCNQGIAGRLDLHATR